MNKNSIKDIIVTENQENLDAEIKERPELDIKEESNFNNDSTAESLVISDEKIALQKIFEPYLSLNNTQAKKLYKYKELLLKYNQKINLTSIVDDYQIAVKHFLDSSLGAQFIPSHAELCDVGSGAGFPAVVLKIVRDDLKVTLIDSVAKKVDFLRRLCETLDIQTQRFITRAETLALTRRETFDCVTARAVASLPTLLEYCAPLVKTGGIFLAYKGPEADTEISEAALAAKTLGMELKSKNDFVLPNKDKRTIIVYVKVNETPRKYPRAQNLPKKKPII
jgi:16S rRNA (guanine527-N7)-methyltransferase